MPYETKSRRRRRRRRHQSSREASKTTRGAPAFVATLRFHQQRTKWFQETGFSNNRSFFRDDTDVIHLVPMNLTLAGTILHGIWSRHPSLWLLSSYLSSCRCFILFVYHSHQIPVAVTKVGRVFSRTKNHNLTGRRRSITLFVYHFQESRYRTIHDTDTGMCPPLDDGLDISPPWHWAPRSSFGRRIGVINGGLGKSIQEWIHVISGFCRREFGHHGIVSGGFDRSIQHS